LALIPINPFWRLETKKQIADFSKVPDFGKVVEILVRFRHAGLY
jgi:hypothetical protein